MPRRVASYDPEFAIWNVIASVGAFMLGVASIPFILNMVSSWARGPQSSAQPLGCHRPGMAAALSATG